MAKRIGKAQPVTSDTGQRVMVSFYDDGSIMFRIHHEGLMAITQAFMGRANEWTNIKVTPFPN